MERMVTEYESIYYSHLNDRVGPSTHGLVRRHLTDHGHVHRHARSWGTRRRGLPAVIGWYIHHHGRGHLARASAVRPHLLEQVTALTSLPAPAMHPFDDWVTLERDDGAGSQLDPTANDRLHWVPLHHTGLAARSRQIVDWIDRNQPTSMVVDVSVEVTMLARLCGDTGDRGGRPRRTRRRAPPAGLRRCCAHHRRLAPRRVRPEVPAPTRAQDQLRRGVLPFRRRRPGPHAGRHRGGPERRWGDDVDPRRPGRGPVGRSRAAVDRRRTAGANRGRPTSGRNYPGPPSWSPTAARTRSPTSRLPADPR